MTLVTEKRAYRRKRDKPMAEEAMTDSERRQAEVKAKQDELDAVNAKREGKGTRLRAGLTRGKGSQIVVWETFDESKPDTLPTTLDEFMKLAATDDEKVIVSYLVEGFNAESYRNASDPVSEHFEPTWDDDIKRQFRIVVKNYAAATGTSIDDAVALIKPGIVKSLAG